MITTKAERDSLFAQMMDYCAQTEAAAFAVLCEHVASNMEETMNANRAGGNQGAYEANCQVQHYFFELRDAALKSIDVNDGRVVHHIGNAAKQLNPLLS